MRGRAVVAAVLVLGAVALSSGGASGQDDEGAPDPLHIVIDRPDWEHHWVTLHGHRRDDPAAFHCQAHDEVSCEGTVAYGEALPSESLGIHRFTVTATQDGGTVTTRTIRYRVVPTCFNRRVTDLVGHDLELNEQRRDTIGGLNRDDRLRGLGGDDVICGRAGADVLNGEEGNDSLDGGRGDDLIIGGPGGGDHCWGGPGQDRYVGCERISEGRP